jgi:hypothetical protein
MFHTSFIQNFSLKESRKNKNNYIFAPIHDFSILKVEENEFFRKTHVIQAK